MEQISGRQKWLRILTALLVALSIGQILGIIVLVIIGCGYGFDEFVTLISGAAFLSVGILIIKFRPGNRVGWILLVSGFGLASLGFQGQYVECSLAGTLSLPGIRWIAWLYHRLLYFFGLNIFILLPFVFPTGRFLTRRWKMFWIGNMVVLATTVFITLFAPDLRTPNSIGSSFPLDSPIGWSGLPENIYQSLFTIQLAIVLIISLTGIVSMFVRLKRSTGVERQQMKWFTYFLVSAVAIQMIFFESLYIFLDEQQLSMVPSWYESLYLVIVLIVFIGLPMVIGLTIFRYRLYDIDIIIRRTLIYGSVSLTLVAIYFGSIILLQWLLRSATNQQSSLAIVLSTLLIAALFNPLRHRIQDFIDRRFYRQKYEANQVLAKFAVTARDEVDLNTLSRVLQEVVNDTLQPEEVSLWLAPLEKEKTS